MRLACRTKLSAVVFLATAKKLHHFAVVETLQFRDLMQRCGGYRLIGLMDWFGRLRFSDLNLYRLITSHQALLGRGIPRLAASQRLIPAMRWLHEFIVFSLSCALGLRSARLELMAKL